jgi:hypothetical protein
MCPWSQCMFFNRYSHPHSAPQAAALQHGNFGQLCPPRSSRLAEKYRKAAAKGGQNEPKCCPICWFHLFRRQINFFAEVKPSFTRLLQSLGRQQTQTPCPAAPRIPRPWPTPPMRRSSSTDPGCELCESISPKLASSKPL